MNRSTYNQSAIILFWGLGVILLAGCSDDEPVDQKKYITFSATFGGQLDDYGASVRQTRDEGYVIAGYTCSFGRGDWDVYLIKTDRYGHEQWSTTFGGNGLDRGYSVQLVREGGYIIVGDTTSYGAGSFDVYLIRTDENGNELWSRTFGGENSEQGWSVQQTSDGGYVISGQTESFGAGKSDVYLIKTDSQGRELWSRTFGGVKKERGFSVQQTSDEGFIIVGEIDNTIMASRGDVLLIKTDLEGSEQWTRTFGGAKQEWGLSVQQTTDDGYIITGSTRSFGNGFNDVYLLKTDAEGHEVWSRSFGGSENDWGYSVLQTKTGFVLTGITYSFGWGSCDVYIIATDPDGNQVWSKMYGGYLAEHGYSVQQTLDGGYIIAGITTSFGVGHCDVYLLKTDPEGNIMIP